MAARESSQQRARGLGLAPGKGATSREEALETWERHLHQGPLFSPHVASVLATGLQALMKLSANHGQDMRTERCHVQHETLFYDAVKERKSPWPLALSCAQ